MGERVHREHCHRTGRTSNKNAGNERLAPRPVVRRIGIDEGAGGRQVYSRSAFALD
jgi:hypothetical protein